MRKIDLENVQAARSETARDINRRLILNLIREGQPISRASLARKSGLQRSTVSLITEQLIHESWVTEGAVGHLPRGRRPTLLQLNPERSGVVGVDIHPATTSVAVAGIDSALIAQASISTRGSVHQFLARLGECISDLMHTHPRDSYVGVGVSVDGGIDPATQRLFFSPGLGWGEVDLGSALKQSIGLPVILENSANACALAELWSGRHGEGARNLVAIMVSEGLGVGIVVNGQLIRGSRGLAGEFGHVLLEENGLPCRCGNRGCVEAYASNTATIRYYSESLRLRRGGKSDRRTQAEISFNDLLLLAEQGNALALEAIDRMAHHLGRATSMVIRGLAPDVVVVAGEVTRLWERVGPKVESEVSTHGLLRPATRIVPVAPDSQPRLLGAIHLILQTQFGSPFLH